MITLTRRGFVAGSSSTIVSGIVGTKANAGENRFVTIDNRSDSAFIYLLNNVEKGEELVSQASAILIMPLITKAGMLLGGAYGEGALRIDGESTGYYSSLQMNVGFQFGALQYSYALFFMNSKILEEFQSSEGWQFGAGLEAVVVRDSQFNGTDSVSRKVDVIALTFAESGMHIGATLTGTKYTRIGA